MPRTSKTANTTAKREPARTVITFSPFLVSSVAGACGNRTHRSRRWHLPAVLKTAQATRPNPPPCCASSATNGDHFDLHQRILRKAQDRDGRAGWLV